MQATSWRGGPVGRVLVLFPLLLALPSPAHATEANGRVVVAIGACQGSHASAPTLSIQRLDAKARRTLRAPAWTRPVQYSDESGAFTVIIESLAAGEWEIYNFESKSPEPMGGIVSHRARADFSWRFRVEPGKLTDLGRFCTASQTEAERYEDWKDKLFNIRVRTAYLLVSSSRPEEIERARGEGGGGMEVVRVAVSEPEKVSPLLRRTWIEPRMIVKTPSAADRPIELPR